MTITQVKDFVLVVGQARVNRDPLDPGLEIRRFLFGLGEIDLRLPVKPLEVGELSLVDPALHELRRKLIEFEQKDRRLAIHCVTPVSEDAIQSLWRDAAGRAAPTCGAHVPHSSVLRSAQGCYFVAQSLHTAL